MRAARHLRIFVAASAAWLLFWIAGLPDYYRQYSTRTMIAFDVLLLPAFAYLGHWFARSARRGRALPASLWLAFYVTVPLFFYDWAYCGWHLGRGLAFLSEYWYLTAYYIVPWVVFPLAAWRVERRRAPAAGTA